jgi:predicted regulator of Ras-like GTPase activity (Roadblock/LC7/MglB family)
MYRFQHSGKYPADGSTDPKDFEDAMLLSSDADGTTGAIGTKPFGPYCVGQLPPRSRTEMMVDCLRDLQAGTPDIEASAVVSVDGLIMASSLPSGVDEDRISAMSAAMLSLGDRIASELSRGNLEQVYIRGSEGFIVLMAVGEDAVLTVLARKSAKLGLIFLDMGRAVEDLARLL